MYYPKVQKDLRRAQSLRSRVLWRWYCLRCEASTLWCRSQRAVKSLIGHWKSRIEQVDIGPAFRRLPDGSYLPEPRTIARSKGIDSELAKYPWMDLIDRQIFLDGFDAGERYDQSTSDN